MNLGVQYYRPPFPVQSYWEDDFKKIANAGLNTVQMWIVWAWVESKPCEFRFDDYDRLIELAEKYGLKLVLSTIAEIQPCWIHREVPGSEMIDNFGQKVVSYNRNECHFGLTPGGCTDNPEVWSRMKNFLMETVTRYRGSTALHGWDAWNELRWNVNATAKVCYCSHTINAFHKWLDDKYGGLDGLNDAWLRRYGQWDEVEPGKHCSMPYTEMMAFEHFITLRSNNHGKARYDLMKALDPDHPVTAHGGEPTIITYGAEMDHALNRGNDWALADNLDGIGCSSFPKWFCLDDADFGMRVESVKSAARGKKVWLSEVQGGRSSQGFNVYASVDAASQQRWIWNGLACGADTILFWCWRDEVFGIESGGYGLIGLDGLAEERIEAMRSTGIILKKYENLFASYQPSVGDVGIFFSPQSYYLYWAQENSLDRSIEAIKGYARSLVRNSIPYKFVEEEHLEELAGLKILFMPRTAVLTEKAEHALEKFVHEGGTLVCESETGAFSPAGIYSYPQDRFIARIAGVCEIGRRQLSDGSITTNIAGEVFELPVNQWLTPLETGKGKVLAESSDGPVIVEVPVDLGKVLLCGTYLGNGYFNERNESFETLLSHFVDAADCQKEFEIISPAKTADSFMYVKHGLSDGRRIVFIFFPKDAAQTEIKFRENLFKTAKMTDIISGNKVELELVDGWYQCTLNNPELHYAVLVEDE